MERKSEGKTAIITGSDSGIGQATAIEFARQGANVVITYLLLEPIPKNNFKGETIKVWPKMIQ